MTARRNAPPNNFTQAQEAIGNLLLPELETILSGGWSAALAAHTEIEVRPVNQRTGPFYRHFLPELKNLISLLAASYRRYFKLALAHPRQAAPDPHAWAWSQLQPFVRLALEWIRNWYILACDGENQFMRRVASTEFIPGRTVSMSIPAAVPPYPPPESWRAPAWLFAVGPPVGIMLMKTENVPERDSEQRLGAAHTRLLLKGARRTFLWELGAAIETVRNEEIAAAGAIPPPTIQVRKSESGKHKGLTREFKGTEGLGRKVSDFSKYMDGLTEKQQLAFSLRLEYRLPLTEVASRMGIDRKTAYEHFLAASKKIDETRSNEKRRAKHAKDHSED